MTHGDPREPYAPIRTYDTEIDAHLAATALAQAGIAAHVIGPARGRPLTTLLVPPGEAALATDVLSDIEKAFAIDDEQRCPRCQSNRSQPTPPYLLIALLASAAIVWGAFASGGVWWAAGTLLAAGAALSQLDRRAPKSRCENSSRRWNDGDVPCRSPGVP
jgi:hypothetical protein